MIDAWTWQIPFSLLGGAISFLVVLGPLLVLQYYSYGRLSAARLLGSAAIAVYAVALVAYTLLPLPDPSVCEGVTGGILQPTPLATLTDISRILSEYGPRSSLALFTIAQPLLNIALFIPLGVLMRAMAGRGILASTFVGALVSLLIETTQYTGMWGMFDCGYRVADVDDLITNTLGALLGAVIAPVVAGWIPRPAALQALPPQPVTRLRRLLGMAIDGFLITTMPELILTAGQLLYALTWSLAAGEATLVDLHRYSPLPEVTALALAVSVTVLLPALSGSGASPGQRLVGIVPVWEGRRGSTGQRLLRAVSVAGVYAVLPPVAMILTAQELPLLPPLMGLAADGVALASIVIVLLVGRRGLSGLISGAELVDRRAARGRAVGARR